MERSQIEKFEDSELTFKDLVKEVRKYLVEIRDKWHFTSVVIIVITTFFLYRAWVSPRIFQASLTFMLNQDENSSMPNFGNILGQFGFAGGNNDQGFNPEKILTLAHSRTIISHGLFQKVEIDGRSDYFANHFINTYNRDKSIQRSIEAGFRFSNDEVSNFNPLENKALKAIYRRINSERKHPNSFLESSVIEGSGIMELSVKSESEEFSIQFVKALFKALGEFYVDKSVERQRRSYEIISSRSDSTRDALISVENRLASLQDRNRNMFLFKNQIDEQQLQREKRILEVIYAEVVKNQQIAEFALQNSTPFIQAIDLPLAPIRGQKKSKLKAFVLGLIIGTVIAATLIVTRRIILNALE